MKILKTILEHFFTFPNAILMHTQVARKKEKEEVIQSHHISINKGIFLIINCAYINREMGKESEMLFNFHFQPKIFD